MQTTQKQHYVAPSSATVEIQMHHVLCESPNPKFGENWNWDD